MDGRLPLALLLLAASACSPDSAPEADKPEARTETAKAAPAPVEPARAAAEPRKAAESPESGKRRCGWLSNPTPANWWLDDAEGQWILSTQGADRAPGMDEMPDMSMAGWVETNGHYGYGCACMTITADGEGKVTRIADAQPKPLKQCRADRKLSEPE
jgi:Protein of unknown function (DUF4087)